MSIIGRVVMMMVMTTNTTALTGRHIYALNPYEIAKVIEYDSKIESEFFAHINALHSLLYICDKAIAAFHNVNSKALGRTEASDIPTTDGLEVSRLSAKVNDNGQNRNEVTPKYDKNVVEKFINFKRVRFVISYFIIHIRHLGNDILAAVDQLEFSKGADGPNVKRDIVTALRTFLDKCAEQVQKLDSTLKCILQRDYLRQIQNDLGWNALDELTSNTLEEIDSLEKKQRDSHVAIKCQMDKMSNYSNLIGATQKQLPHSHSNVEAKESRLKTLGETIAAIRPTIAEAPASASSHEYLQWLHWWITKDDYGKNENLKGTEEIAYYDSLVYVRTKAKPIPGVRVDKKQNERIKKDLKESYNVYNSKYKKAKAELGNSTATFKSTMGKYQFKIGGLIKKLSRMPELNGMLMFSFACIETFVKSIENRSEKDVSASAFQSLFEILSGIESLISSDVELLSSDERLDIFVAGKRLRKDAAFLLNFAEDLMYL